MKTWEFNEGIEDEYWIGKCTQTCKIVNIIITLKNVASKLRIHKRCNLFCTQCLSLVIDGEMKDNVFKECVKNLKATGLPDFFKA